VHRGNIVRIKEAADCRSIFKRFWPKHFRERGNCFCPFHDDSKSSFQVSRKLTFCHAENLKLDVVDLYARATGTTNGEAVAQLAKELGLRPRSPGHCMVAVYDYADADSFFRVLHETKI
jgi:hypothetical protein